MSDTENTNIIEPERNDFPISPSTKNTGSYVRGDYESQFGVEQGKEDSLQRELETVRNINEVIEKVLSSLECAQENMDKTVSQTVKSASVLLDTWVRILSNTEHNQKLIMNPRWKGASIDIANMEKESSLKAQAEVRRAIEEEKRKEESRKREEEEERQRQAGTSARSRSALRGSRGTKRGSTHDSSHFSGRLSNLQSNARGTHKGRTGSGIGRGLGASRVRLRGTR
ncbi:hypothetical protein Golomagni_00599 [Golovinomyces magnicellulatus]|nr:hypothetical protein Golomagni_00599 [Golovinomyces magnicellulatus]